MKRTPLKKTSIKTAKSNYIILKNKKKRINQIGNRCEICGRYCEPDYVHIIRRSASLVLRDNPRNFILGCRECHSLFDDGDARLLKGHFKAVLSRMKSLDEHYYNRYVDKRL